MGVPVSVPVSDLISDTISISSRRFFSSSRAVAPLSMSGAVVPMGKMLSSEAPMPWAGRAGQVFICTGKQASTNTYPAMAGLNRLQPIPPKACLAMMTANAIPHRQTHQGASGVMLTANSKAVTVTLPSRRNSAGSRPRSLRTANSSSRAKQTASAHWINTPGPNSQA